MRSGQLRGEPMDSQPLRGRAPGRCRRQMCIRARRQSTRRLAGGEGRRGPTRTVTVSLSLRSHREPERVVGGQKAISGGGRWWWCWWWWWWWWCCALTKVASECRGWADQGLGADVEERQARRTTTFFKKKPAPGTRWESWGRRTGAVGLRGAAAAGIGQRGRN